MNTLLSGLLRQRDLCPEHAAQLSGLKVRGLLNGLMAALACAATCSRSAADGLAGLALSATVVSLSLRLSHACRPNESATMIDSGVLAEKCMVRVTPLTGTYTRARPVPVANAAHSGVRAAARGGRSNPDSTNSSPSDAIGARQGRKSPTTIGATNKKQRRLQLYKMPALCT